MARLTRHPKAGRDGRSAALKEGGGAIPSVNESKRKTRQKLNVILWRNILFCETMKFFSGAL
jgi:hypothetical protein